MRHGSGFQFSWRLVKSNMGKKAHLGSHEFANPDAFDRRLKRGGGLESFFSGRWRFGA